MAVPSIRANNELTDESAAVLASEIARLDTLLTAFPDNTRKLLATEMRGSPVREYLREEDGDRAGELALVRARARLAAYDARMARRPPLAASSPPWLKTVLKSIGATIIVPIVLAFVIALITSQRQLTLYREQTSHDAMRKQADLLLTQLSSMVVRATQLRNSVSFQEDSGLSEGTVEVLKREATQLQTDFAETVRLHDFTAFPQLQKSQLRAYYEIAALLECLDRKAGRPASSRWREDEQEKDVLKDATSDAPCATNFDVNAFERFKDAVKQNVDQRIGGALFPRRPEAK